MEGEKDTKIYIIEYYMLDHRHGRTPIKFTDASLAMGFENALKIVDDPRSEPGVEFVRSCIFGGHFEEDTGLFVREDECLYDSAMTKGGFES